MALRSDRHRISPVAALAPDAGTMIGPRCATIHVGQEDERLPRQAGYTTATDSKDRKAIRHSRDNREESIYGLLGKFHASPNDSLPGHPSGKCRCTTEIVQRIRSH
jgi:hypothetical protein